MHSKRVLKLIWLIFLQFISSGWSNRQRPHIRYRRHIFVSWCKAKIQTSDIFEWFSNNSKKAWNIFEKTLFENYSKCCIWIFQCWYFPPISVLLKIDLSGFPVFDYKLRVFQKLFTASQQFLWSNHTERKVWYDKT